MPLSSAIILLDNIILSTSMKDPRRDELLVVRNIMVNFVDNIVKEV